MKDSGLTRHQIEIISETVLREHQKLKKIESKEQKDWRLRNTNLLLKNYRLLSKHCEEITEKEENGSFNPIYMDLETLMKYKTKTKVMIKYFDSVFTGYKEFCNNNGFIASRRYSILDSMYVSEYKKSADELADFYNIHRTVVFRDVKKATYELSIMLFGVDSIQDLFDII
ncbi:hypothetical protein HOY36_12785 [Enterococcus sp. MMGLQ5-2]|nr:MULTISPECIES: hypothetical protein [unclassified Enterococcus]MBS7578393.1 hypothetical protein [Enterococcus sp. MMGLQ5-2]MBS7585624.1 hypothetical protein [Enterococcus sp. MMGLQ5-1]NPD13483.1 hypothetical protein [Enterococcus sp. MMGLQ5-1]NPD38225.1 hypothetical protein [Enterococcus sp. MMGLQ5-2]